MAEEKTEKKEKQDPNALVAQFQILQQQLQNVLIQKETVNMSIMEIDRAVEELNKSKESEAYKITGTVMVKKSVEYLKKELGESKEAMQIILKSVERSEKILTDKLKELQSKLQEIMK